MLFTEPIWKSIRFYTNQLRIILTMSFIETFGILWI